MSTVTPLYVKRPGLRRGEGVPRSVEIDETAELLIQALKYAFTLETIWRVRDFETRHGRHLAPLHPPKVARIVDDSRTLAPGAFSWKWDEDQRPLSRAINWIAASVVRDLYGLRHRSEVGAAMTDAKAWWRATGARELQAAVKAERWLAFRDGC